MGKKLAYERYYWLQGQIKASRYPIARKLAEKFGISEKQAQREIEFMRDRLGAILVYNSSRKGYEIPLSWCSPFRLQPSSFNLFLDDVGHLLGE